MAGIVAVFDFDKTIIDCDSDNWVVDELGAADLFNDLLPTMPWNSLMVCFCSRFNSLFYVLFCSCYMHVVDFDFNLSPY
jgi:hypothetical protein